MHKGPPLQAPALPNRTWAGTGCCGARGAPAAARSSADRHAPSTVAGWCPLGLMPSWPPQSTPRAYPFFLSFFAHPARRRARPAGVEGTAHALGMYRAAGAPLVIGSDDPGIMRGSLSGACFSVLHRAAACARQREKRSRSGEGTGSARARVAAAAGRCCRGAAVRPWGVTSLAAAASCGCHVAAQHAHAAGSAHAHTLKACAPLCRLQTST